MTPAAAKNNDMQKLFIVVSPPFRNIEKTPLMKEVMAMPKASIMDMTRIVLEVFFDGIITVLYLYLKMRIRV